jgi:ribosomal protein S18 acetylase RimI-like enzyme
MKIIIKSPRTREEFKAYYALRYAVLREPIGLQKGTEKDDYEPISVHFMAVDQETGQLLGTVKVYEKEPGKCQISHMAVSEKHRHQGIGKLLLDTAEAKACEMGCRTAIVLTRANATGYYQQHGYEVIGIAGNILGRLQLLWMEKGLVEEPAKSEDEHE